MIGHTAGDVLRAASDMYFKKNKEYGNNYKVFGNIMTAMFPDGLVLKTSEDFNRAAVFFHIIDKETRYAQNFTKGGHSDSLLDSAVYNAMLSELDNGNKSIT